MIGEHIKARREKLGYSQAELAKICDLSENYISALERGVKNAGPKAIQVLSDALGVDEATLRFGERDPKKESPQVPEHLRALFEQIAQVFPDSASLIRKSETLAQVMRDLRNDDRNS